MHLSDRHGHTVDEIVAEGWPIIARVAIPVVGDTPEKMAHSMGMGTAAMGAALALERPDILLVLGDRFEMFAAAMAAVPFSIPLAHIHGGELTLGAMDDAFRHCLTKLSHLHFPATAAYGRRIMQMGEEPWRVTVAGAPALDAFMTEDALPDAVVAERLGFALDDAPALVTLHSETRGHVPPSLLADRTITALADLPCPIIITAPNADPGGAEIAEKLKHFAAGRARTVYVESLGARAYRTILARARVMIGNSSSGLIEAASFRLPVVNIGERQAGRVRAANVIDTPADTAAIEKAVARAESDAFRATLSGLVNPYGDGHASARIVSVLRDVPLDMRLMTKRFHDLEALS
jgi:UDP-hydrolysing UDP-N-acetyl-D-glucosamine 2-epimerase